MSSAHVPSAPPASLVVSIDWVGGAVLLSGELDREGAHHLVDALTALSATAHREWVVDTAEVTWCDASGLRALAQAHALAVSSGRALRLVRPSRCVDRLVTLSGLGQLIADGLASAPAAPASGRRPGQVRRLRAVTAGPTPVRSGRGLARSARR